MNILTLRYEAWFRSRQTSVSLGFGEREYSQHLHNRYQKVYFLFGYKVWTYVCRVEVVPVYAWAQVGTCGFTDFRDDFCTKYPRLANKFHSKKESVILTSEMLTSKVLGLFKVA